MVNLRSACFAFAAAAFSSSSVAFAGPGDLLVSPVRVIFEGRDRVAEVTLVNKGDSDAVYRVSFKNRHMRDDGSFEEITTEDDGHKFAEDLVRFAPRRVELAPNAPQTIRLMLRKPADLEDGEYRSHLHFAAVPKSSETNSINKPKGDGKNVSIELTPIYGVTIPVIVRDGDVNVSTVFEDIDIVTDKEGRSSLTMNIMRSGNKSLYGDVGIYLPGKKEPVLHMRGIAVYTPNLFRKVSLPLTAAAEKALRGKGAELRFDERTSTGVTTLAAVDFALPK